MTGLHEVAGGIIGMPFSLEGFAFFTEAVFIGIYLYGWNRVGPRTHAAGGAIAALSAAASAIFVTTANSWMNTPVGFRLVAGQPLDVNPIAAMTCAAAQATLILWGWAFAQYPCLVEPDLTIYNTVAPTLTIRLLAAALALGTLLALPSYGYLLTIFKTRAHKAATGVRPRHRLLED